MIFHRLCSGKFIDKNLKLGFYTGSTHLNFQKTKENLLMIVAEVLFLRNENICCRIHGIGENPFRKAAGKRAWKAVY